MCIRLRESDAHRARSCLVTHTLHIWQQTPWSICVYIYACDSLFRTLRVPHVPEPFIISSLLWIYRYIDGAHCATSCHGDERNASPLHTVSLRQIEAKTREESNENDRRVKFIQINCSSIPKNRRRIHKSESFALAASQTRRCSVFNCVWVRLCIASACTLNVSIPSFGHSDACSLPLKHAFPRFVANSHKMKWNRSSPECLHFTSIVVDHQRRRRRFHHACIRSRRYHIVGTSFKIYFFSLFASVPLPSVPPFHVACSGSMKTPCI